MTSSPSAAPSIEADDELPEVDLRTLLGQMARLEREVRASTVEVRAARQQVEDAQQALQASVAEAARREEALRAEAGRRRREAALALIDVADRVEAALRSAVAPSRPRWPWSSRPDTGAIDAMRQGLRLTLEGIEERLRGFGTRRVAAAGRPFDPHRMEALKAEDRAGAQEGEVLEEIVSGWEDEAGPLRLARVVVQRRQPAA